MKTKYVIELFIHAVSAGMMHSTQSVFVVSGGPVRMETLKWVDKQKLHEFIHKTTAPETENIYTDEHPGYRGPVYT